MNDYTINLRLIRPPIPDRRYDWQASEDGWEPGMPIGHGPTRFSALLDLLEQIDEREEEKAETMKKRES